jgi:hypothetical protein
LQVFELLRLQVIIFVIPDIQFGYFKIYQGSISRFRNRGGAKEKVVAAFAEAYLTVAAYCPIVRYTGRSGSRDDFRAILRSVVIIKFKGFYQCFFRVLFGGKCYLSSGIVNADIMVVSPAAA